MKHLTKLIPTAALVLMALGCQREQVVKETPSPLYDPETKEVTTSFVLNVTSAAQTKQTADVAQLNQNFRGIEKAKIFCYKTGLSDQSKTPYVLTTSAPDAANVKEFDLGLLMSGGSLDNTTGTNNQSNNLNNSSNRVLQLSIPVGVDAVMIYGKAIKGNAMTDADYGCTLDYNPHDGNKVNKVSSTPSTTQFAAHTILDAGNSKDYDATGALMIYIINKLLSTEVGGNGSVKVGTGTDAVTFDDLPAVSWAQYGHRYEYDLKGDKSRYLLGATGVEMLDHKCEGLEETLGKCYYLFTYITPAQFPEGWDSKSDADKKAWIEANFQTAGQFGEYRGGSSFAVRKQVIDMYKIISAAKDATPTNHKEANAKRLADFIITTAETYINSPTAGSDAGKFKSVETIKQLLTQAGQWSTGFDGAQDLDGYPFEDFGIPEGAAQLVFDCQGDPGITEDAFRYIHPNHPLVNPLMPEFEPRKYVYPAELWYYVNSPIRTNSSDVNVADYPNGVTPWNATGSWEGWVNNASVASATRAVAVTTSLNYGVALLKSVVTVTAPNGKLHDNRKAKTDENSDREISVNSAQISLRGILVGGVNPRMNWQFTRYYTTTGQPGGSEGDLSLFDGVIYDHATGNPQLSTTSDIKNYTLVYDNYNSSEGEENQNDVYVALEFVNGGDAFWGRDNLIPSGGVFYLVGKLPKPTSGQISDFRNSATTPKFPDDHQIPPLYGVDGETFDATKYYAGESKQIPRVFIQDFMTTASFQVGVDALKHAYYSVPDLRASQMSLGLSVDLQWNEGISFAVGL